MPGNFDCIGFAVDSSEALATLVEKMLPAAEPIGTRGDAETFRWQDESGARLVFDVKRNTVNNVLPSFAADNSTLVAAVQSVNDDTSFADIVDEQGETITRLAVDLEQRALIRGNTVRGSASLVGLVGQVSLFADEVEFRASPASLLGPADQDFGPPPPDFERDGSALRSSTRAIGRLRSRCLRPGRRDAATGARSGPCRNRLHGRLPRRLEPRGTRLAGRARFVAGPPARAAELTCRSR